MLYFATYIFKFISILGLYFVSLFNVNLAFGLFLLYIGLSIFIDTHLRYKDENTIKSQKQELTNIKNNFDISAIVGSKLLEKYVEKTGDTNIMEQIMKELKEEFDHELANKSKM